MILPDDRKKVILTTTNGYLPVISNLVFSIIKLYLRIHFKSFHEFPKDVDNYDKEIHVFD